MRWLRWWDNEGNLLLTGSEEAKLERLHTEQERQRADAESQRAVRAACRRHIAPVQIQWDAIGQLLGMGLTVEQVAQALSLSVADVERVD